MISLFVSLLGIFITIFFVIGIHESAHFFMAKWLGIKVLRFSLGFGKTLLKWKDKQQTEYVIALLPLGGYVKMLDNTFENIPDHEKSLAFNYQPLYKRLLVILAGPAANLLSALLLYWFVFMMGIVTIKPVIGEVAPHSIAAQSGLKPLQEITFIDHSPILSWGGVNMHLLKHLGNKNIIRIDTRPWPINKTSTHFPETPTTHYLNTATWQINPLKPNPLESIGITPYVPPTQLTIGSIDPHSTGASGLKKGDKIIKIGETSIASWEVLTHFIHDNPGKIFTFTIQRNQKLLTIPIQIEAKYYFFKKYGRLGIGPSFNLPPSLIRKIQYSPVPAFIHAFKEMKQFILFNVILFSKLITGKLSLQSLGGPILIFEQAGTSLNAGISSFFLFLAFLSISIGIINIIPLPGLDGGQVFIQLIEAVCQKPLSPAVLSLIYQISFVFLLLIFIQVITNDILRFF